MRNARIKAVWVAVTAAMVAMAWAGGEARAGGIAIQTGVTQGGDPQYTYYINVILNPNTTIPAYNPTYGGGPAPVPAQTEINLTGITGLAAGADTITLISQNPGPPAAIWTEVTGTDSITVDYYGYGSIVNSLSLGVTVLKFTVVTPDTPDQKGLTPGSAINYSYSVGGSSPTGGTVNVQSGAPVPEPSSLVLILTGSAILPYQILRNRRLGRSANSGAR